MNKKPRPEQPPAKAAVVAYEARVFRAGNSLAVRIPIALARHFDLSDGAVMAMSVENDTICLRRTASADIEALIARITPENQHEPMFDELIGRERW